MKYVTLIASEVVNGKKVTLGSQENFPIAESLLDMQSMENEDNGWNADEIVACFNYGSRVKRQTQLRAKTTDASNVKVFKSLSIDKQEDILRQHGLL